MNTSVSVRGWVGNNVELRTTAKGDEHIRFRLASSSGYVRDGSWVETGTVWLTVTAWRDLARNVAASIRKGDPVYVQGKLRLESWTDKKTNEVVEDKVLEATVVGHDLTRGTTHFSRRRHDDEPDAASQASVSEPVEDEDVDDAGEDVTEEHRLALVGS